MIDQPATLPPVPDEAPTRQLAGFPAHLTTALAIGLSLYSLYWVLFVVQPQVYRVSFLLVALVLTFLLVPGRARLERITAIDWVLAATAIVVLSWPLADFDRFVYRAADPLPLDVVFGAVAVLLVLEAARRSVGWILPVTAAAFLAYAMAGPWFDRIGLPLLAHRGYPID